MGLRIVLLVLMPPPVIVVDVDAEDAGAVLIVFFRNSSGLVIAMCHHLGNILRDKEKFNYSAHSKNKKKKRTHEIYFVVVVTF